MFPFTSRRLVVVMLSSALALLAATPATAGEQTSTGPSISVEQLILEPIDRGYLGALSVTVTNDSEFSNDLSIMVTEPVAGSFQGLGPDSFCGTMNWVGNRRVWGCAVPGSSLAPGEQRSFTVPFQVLTTVRPYSMITSGGTISLTLSGTSEVADSSDFTTRFRSTTGSLGNPQLYVQDTMADATIATIGQLTLTRQSDGRFTGRLPTTVSYGGDAGHESLGVRVTGLPDGFQVAGTDPQELPSFFTMFPVPGPRFMPGEVRGFDVLFEAPAEAPVGDLGSVSFELSTYWGGNPVPDVDPTDNTVSFTVTTVEAS